MKMTVFRDAALYRLVVGALMMEAISISETPVNFYQTTRRNIPEDSHLLAAGSSVTQDNKERRISLIRDHEPGL
jgi:hypothetical protein